MSKLTSLTRRSEYFELLKSMGLWPVDSKKEHNWSGRGQHVEFKSNEMGKVNELLSFQECLGSGISGTVDKVKCSRIFLARKTISTRTRLTKSQAIEEVAQMDRHKHSHIIRLIGSYTLKTNLCILMYPVADHSLGTFLEALGDLSLERAQVTAMASSCSGFFSCLSSALRYIHSSWTKHMDIKPLNILVRTRWRYSGGGHSEYHSKVYLSDFGIARSYPSFETINTDGAAAFTRKYAAPEVIQQMHHGLSVDIFSLGCVFLEMFAALDEFKAVQLPNALQETRSPAQFSCTMQQELQDLLNSNKTSDESYQGNLNLLQKLLEARIPCYKGASVLNSSTLTTILKMIRSVPQQRPTADDLIQEFGEKACCKTGPDKLEEADIDWEHDFNWSPNRRIDFNQERIHSIEPWTQPILSGSTVYHHLSGTMSEELREHMAYQTLLTSHMGGVWS
jgi:serine/threonine protein kinase